MIFDSDLLHRTGDFEFRPRYEIRRVNIAMLFGYRRARAAKEFRSPEAS